MILALSVFAITLLHGMKEKPEVKPDASAALRQLQEACEGLPGDVSDIFKNQWVEAEKLAHFTNRYPQNLEVVLETPTRKSMLLSNVMALSMGMPMGAADGMPARLSDNMSRKTLRAAPKEGDVLLWKGGNDWDYMQGTVTTDADGQLALKDIDINFCPVTAEMQSTPGMLGPIDASSYDSKIDGKFANIEYRCAYDPVAKQMLTKELHGMPTSGKHGAVRPDAEVQIVAGPHPTSAIRAREDGRGCCGHSHHGHGLAELTIKALKNNDSDEDVIGQADMELIKRTSIIIDATLRYCYHNNIMSESNLVAVTSGDEDNLLEGCDRMLTDEQCGQILEEAHRRNHPSTHTIDTSDIEQVRQAIKPETLRHVRYVMENAPQTMEGRCSSNGRQGTSQIVMNRAGQVITENFWTGPFFNMHQPHAIASDSDIAEQSDEGEGIDHRDIAEQNRCALQ